MDFFIIGSQRSGTNLMRLILNSHPNAWVFGEGTAYYALEHNMQDPREVHKYWLSLIIPSRQKFALKPSFDKDIKHYGYTVPGWTELFTEYQCIKERLENRAALFMVRNPLDIAASMMGFKDFIKELEVTMRTWMTDSNRRLKSRFGHLLHQDDPNWLVRWIAVYWRYKTEFYFDMLKNNQKVMLVKYEDLVNRPVVSVKNIVDFLKIPWHDDLLRHHEKVHSEMFIDGRTNGDTLVTRAIDTTVVGRGKGLSEDKIKTILDVNLDLMKVFGYDNLQPNGGMAQQEVDAPAPKLL